MKFLTTLERHFKNLTEGDLTTMLDTIPSMLKALRMVWVISRYFNRDHRMRPLMERIADTIAERVAAQVDMPTMLRGDGVGSYNAEDAVEHLQLAHRVVTNWEKVSISISFSVLSPPPLLSMVASIRNTRTLARRWVMIVSKFAGISCLNDCLAALGTWQRDSQI